mmetsp:Transcript_4989/g.17574  ORF Transcript_4989/g.17574 Transcript_4989/m.17574 type:complete len:369 (-) Transcript_4989:4381-5487(-)
MQITRARRRQVAVRFSTTAHARRGPARDLLEPATQNAPAVLLPAGVGVGPRNRRRRASQLVNGVLVLAVHFLRQPFDLGPIRDGFSPERFPALFQARLGQGQGAILLRHQRFQRRNRLRRNRLQSGLVVPVKGVALRRPRPRRQSGAAGHAALLQKRLGCRQPRNRVLCRLAGRALVVVHGPRQQRRIPQGLFLALLCARRELPRLADVVGQLQGALVRRVGSLRSFVEAHVCQSRRRALDGAARAQLRRPHAQLQSQRRQRPRVHSEQWLLRPKAFIAALGRKGVADVQERLGFRLDARAVRRRQGVFRRGDRGLETPVRVAQRNKFALLDNILELDALHFFRQDKNPLRCLPRRQIPRRRTRARRP